MSLRIAQIMLIIVLGLSSLTQIVPVNAQEKHNFKCSSVVSIYAHDQHQVSFPITTYGVVQLPDDLDTETTIWVVSYPGHLRCFGSEMKNRDDLIWRDYLQTCHRFDICDVQNVLVNPRGIPELLGPPRRLAPEFITVPSPFR